jgi:pimeloyl-ACP methyl ester carboxylesterase
LPRINIGDCRVNYKSEGRGRCVALLHGIGGTLNDFEPLVPLLAEKFRVVRLDQRGFGRSDKPHDKPYSTQMWANDLSQLLRGLHIQRAVIVGHSMGGRIACHFAATHPTQTAGLVVLDSTMWGSNVEGAAELRAGIGRIATEGMQAFAKSTPWSRSLGPRQRRISEFVARETLANDPSAYALAAETVAADFAGESDSSFLNKIDCPVLVVVGDRDSAPLEGALKMRREIRGAHLSVVQDCGHFSFLEKPGILGSMLADFIRNAYR